MPTYQYECLKCKKTFELFQSMKDDSLKTCPKDRCRMKKWGKGRVKRLLGAGAGLIFKGSGFYITDYRSDSYKSAAKKESPVTSTAGEKSTAPKETAAKPPPAAATKTPEKKPDKGSSA